MLANPVANPPPYLMELPVSGGFLLALAMVDLDRGARAGDQQATRSGARMVALAERFGFLRNFQPTMSAARAREAAERADGPAYDDAVSSYAGLGHEDCGPPLWWRCGPGTSADGGLPGGVGVAVVQLPGPQVADQGDDDAPGDGEPRCCRSRVPSSRPRRVSMAGVNGWYSANRRNPVGIESTGTKALERSGSRISGIGLLLAASAVWLIRPMPTAIQVSAMANSTSSPNAASHSTGRGVGPEADEHGDRDDDGHAQDRLDHAADDVPDEHRGAVDRHRAEAGDDALGHVVGDGDRGSDATAAMVISRIPGTT